MSKPWTSPQAVAERYLAKTPDRASLHYRAKGLVQLARRKPLGTAGAAIVLLMVVVALFAPVIAPYDPLETHYSDRLHGPQWEYPLGTDDFGRDVLSRLIMGTRSALSIAVVSVAIGVTAGGLIGLVSAFWGGWLDMIVQRFMDGLLAFPILVLALGVVAMLGPQDIYVIIALAVVNMPIASRLLRAVALSTKEELYVTAARVLGASEWRLLFRHILPNILSPYLVVVSTQFAWAVIVAASLSFLGVASPPPEPSWGRMLAEGTREFAERAPWLVIFPGLFVSLAVFGFNLLGDAVRDALDPRLRSR